MPQPAIFGPMFATLLLTLAIWVYLYIRRISFISGSGISRSDLAVPGALAQLSPPQVSNPSDTLKNLFEMPVLSYLFSSLALWFIAARAALAYLAV